MDRFADYVATKCDTGEALRALTHLRHHHEIRGAREQLWAAAIQPVLDAGAAAANACAPTCAAEDVVVGVVGIFP